VEAIMTRRVPLSTAFFYLLLIPVAGFSQSVKLETFADSLAEEYIIKALAFMCLCVIIKTRIEILI